jgi:glucose/arabinose dehydrogenase
MRRNFAAVTAVAGIAVTSLLLAAGRAPAPGCDAGNAGLTVPPGFCAGVFARGIPAPRHMAVAGNGDVFVISNTGRQRPNSAARGVYRLRDANGDGKADTTERIADGTGSGIWIANNALYSEAGGTVIVRYPFRSGSTDLSGAVDTIVYGLPGGPGHVTRDFAIRGRDLFVNVGSGSNICAQGGGTNPPGPDPCPELPTRAGIWRFDANKTGQVFSPAQRYATGVRNAVSITVNPRDNEVYTLQHGRDDLGNWNNNTTEYNAENPGEEFFHIVQGGDYGWPYCYYAVEQKKKVTGPEYGGDGKKDDRCADKQKPIYAFPGHWAPNGSLFYSGSQFPAEYKDGVFAAFHGSWNRAPLPQEGFNVSFLPLKSGKAAGVHRVFADGFYDNRPSQQASHRPVGLAQGRDGSLLVSDDVGGLIYRIMYTGK